LWAMEEGLRCSGLACVIGELWGNPRALDFTATRRLAVASERSGVAAFLVRLGGTANLSGARMRWRIASAPSLPNDLDPRAPGAPAWDTELFRARGSPPGRWTVGHEAGAFRLVAEPGDRALETSELQGERLRA
jgi:protein ImuA